MKGSVTKRARSPHPGRALFRSLTRRRAPVQMEKLTDLDVLRILFSDEQARGIVEKCGPAGLAAFSRLGASGPRALLELPGVDEATASRLLAVFELAVRVE